MREPTTEGTLRCPYCTGSGPIVYRDVALCACGVAYRTRPSPNAFRYSPASFTGHLAENRARMTRIVARLDWVDRAPAILDVGAGHGLLYDAIVDAGITPRRYVALEPSEPLAGELKRRNGVQVVRGSLDGLPADDRFDVIFVLGVDYLFADINRSYVILASLLAPGGTIVIQRNVFLEQTAYMGRQPIATLFDLFGVNPMIMQWFQLDQYVSFLARFFTIAAMFKEQGQGGGFLVTCLARGGGSTSGVIGRPDEAREALRRLRS
jgi:SAM-dependent methyltransferase